MILYSGYLVPEKDKINSDIELIAYQRPCMIRIIYKQG